MSKIQKRLIFHKIRQNERIQPRGIPIMEENFRFAVARAGDLLSHGSGCTAKIEVVSGNDNRITQDNYNDRITTQKKM